MFEALDQLIEVLISIYSDINNRWKSTESFHSINLKRKTVADIQANPDILEMALQFRTFAIGEQMKILQSINHLQSEKNRISTRIKQRNSIEYKLIRYNNGKLQGEVPINKCLNDLFGIRIIIDDSFTHNDLVAHISYRYPKMKLIDSSKDGYVATHLYIMTDNYLFPWELQIWKKEDERNNLESHKLYKQDYTSWEKDYKKE